MNPARHDAIEKLCHGRDPFASFPRGLYGLDDGGWNSKHEYLNWSVLDLLSATVIEIGVWKGGSTIELASRLREHVGHGVVIAVDTWLGSPEHRMNPRGWDSLCPEYGHPMIYRQFLANVVGAGLQDYVVPFPCDSLNAAVCMRIAGIVPDIIHLDAAHEYEAVKADIAAWWPLLRTGGHMIFDDYDGSGNGWPGVRRAVDEHLAEVEHDYFQFRGMKSRVRKL